MLAHVRVAWATDLRHLVHLLQPEYASFLRFPRFFPYMRRFTPIIELNVHYLRQSRFSGS